jgi:hypothetical protein
MVNETRGIATETGKVMRLSPVFENSVVRFGPLSCFPSYPMTETWRVGIAKLIKRIILFVCF